MKKPSICLQQKLMIAFLTALLLPISLFGIYGYSQYVASVRTESESYLQQSLTNLRQSITDKFEQVQTLLQKTTTNPMLMNYFNNYSLTDLDYVQFSLQYFSNFVQWLESIGAEDLQLHFYTDNDKVFENQYVTHVDMSGADVEFYQNTCEGTLETPRWEHGVLPYRKHYPTIKDTAECFTAYYPLMNYSASNPSTVVSAGVPYSYLFSAVSTFAQYEFLITDTQGAILFASPDLSVSDQERIDPATFCDSDHFLFAQESLDDYDMTVYMRTSTTSITDRMHRLKIAFVISMLAAVVFATAASYIISRNLTRRLSQLTQTMQKIQTSDCDVVAQVDGNDEIAIMAKSFNDLLARIRRLNEIHYKAEILRRDAMVKALENQINPHFIYNTLTTISMMAEAKGEFEISDAIVSLSSIVRYNLKKNGDLIPLSQEMEHLKNYCRLHTLMLNGQLSFSVEADSETMHLYILKLALQPIVENAILHGFHDCSGPCSIHMRAWVQEKKLYVTVTDNGVGIEPERLCQLRMQMDGKLEQPLPTAGSGIALQNVHQRIRLKYGAEYGLRIESEVCRGTCVTAVLPVIENDAKGDVSE